jgi:hypothetical protein
MEPQPGLEAAIFRAGLTPSARMWATAAPEENVPACFS